MSRRLLLVAALALALAGCSNPEAPGGLSGHFRVGEVNVKGRQVTCVTWTAPGGNGGGVSCDWSLR